MIPHTAPLARIANVCRYLSRACWKCNNKTLKTFICDGCGALQPTLKPGNYFKLMGIPETYNVNLRELKKRYNMLQTSVHPDVIAGDTTAGSTSNTGNAPPNILEVAETLSAEINHAHDVLKDDMRRAEYIASLYNIGSAVAPPALLIDQMVLRDQIDLDYQKKNVQRMIDMHQALNGRFSAASQMFGEALRNKDSGRMSSLLCEMRFLTSTLGELKKRLSELDTM